MAKKKSCYVILALEVNRLTPSGDIERIVELAAQSIEQNWSVHGARVVRATSNPEVIRREALRRREDFMRIKATGHEIHMWLQKERCTPGIDWSGSSKGSIAESYAIGERGLDEDVLQRLWDHFGKRPL